MSAGERALEVIRAWVAKAEADWKSATYLLRMGRACPTDVVCFHCQKCVEKYLKALLAARRIEFPKTHDIERLVGMLPRNFRPSLPIDEQRRLTGYATLGRYPGAAEEASLAEARAAVQVVQADPRRGKEAFAQGSSLAGQARPLGPGGLRQRPVGRLAAISRR